MKAAAAILLALVCCAQCASASRLFMAREEFQAEQTGRRALMAAGGESVARGLPLQLPRASHCRCHTLGGTHSTEWACPGRPPSHSLTAIRVTAPAGYGAYGQATGGYNAYGSRRLSSVGEQAAAGAGWGAS
jgi:hypothetical protein